jgi:hypothetical protein
MIGGMYRSAVVANPGYYLSIPQVAPFVPKSIDLSGVGARFSLGIGF